MPSMFKSPPKPKLPPLPVPVPAADPEKNRRARGVPIGRGGKGGRASTLLSDEKLGGG